MPRPPPRSTLFPYTTLFRSQPNQIGMTRSIRTCVVECGVTMPDRNTKTPQKNTTRVKRLSNTKCRQCRSRSEEHTSELQSRENLVCRLLLEKKKKKKKK